MTRRLAGVMSIVIMGAALYPIVQNFRDERQDSFPLSYYPMFSRKRSEVRRVRYLIGYDAEGNRHTIHYRYAGVGGMNQVRRQIRKRVRNGQADVLCAAVAKRVSRLRKPPLSKVVTVQVITGDYRMDDFFRGNKTPLKEKIEASCPVVRSEE